MTVTSQLSFLSPSTTCCARVASPTMSGDQYCETRQNFFRRVSMSVLLSVPSNDRGEGEQDYPCVGRQQAEEEEAERDQPVGQCQVVDHSGLGNHVQCPHEERDA